MDPSEDRQKLDPEWIARGNNICGTLRGCRDADSVAERFTRIGWRARSSSWYGYEVENSWCQVEIEPLDAPDLLLNGVVDPERLDELAGLLRRLGLCYALELSDDDDNVVREIQG
ncbi:hypothetical protein ACIQ7Q_03950 [Streptomyces sp. NPDC096176]|uniref:hypothetical protein n=1 Tax=Streptomyces sp. NPDC096176 TaxID=3366079 RepID=UPI003801AF52